jgi:hypothetical protein
MIRILLESHQFQQKLVQWRKNGHFEPKQKHERERGLGTKILLLLFQSCERDGRKRFLKKKGICFDLNLSFDNFTVFVCEIHHLIDCWYSGSGRNYTSLISNGRIFNS